jgi:hypothetical protein
MKIFKDLIPRTGAALILCIVPLFAGSIPTSTTLSTSVNPSIAGRNVTLTATVSPSDASGRITYYDGATVLATQVLAHGQALQITALLPSGTRRLRVRYSGDAAYAASTSVPLRQIVNTVAGTFGAAFPVYDGGGHFGGPVITGDFNGDGLADVVAAGMEGGDQSLTLLSSSGSAFQPAITLDVRQCSAPRSLATGDFNGDGKADLAVGSSCGVNVFLGNGDGTFQTPLRYQTRGDQPFIVTGDFNADGIPDLAVAGSGISIMQGNGDGTFLPGQSYPIEGAVVVSDFDGDGNADLATGSGVLLGNGDGTFRAPKSLGLAGICFARCGDGAIPASLTADDLDGDGNADLIVADPGGNRVVVLPGNGDGTFRSPVSYGVGADPVSVATGDFNGDGRTDIVAGTGDGLSVLSGNGDGTFRTAVNYMQGIPVSFVVVGAFQGDGRVDLVFSAGSGLSLLPGIAVAPDDDSAARLAKIANVAVTPGYRAESVSSSRMVVSPPSAPAWSPLNNQPTFEPDAALLLTDGSVLVHEYCSSNWHRLVPDIFGSYVNGTWKTAASMPSNYGPLYFSSAVLADGRAVVIGGEYNKADGCVSSVDTNLGAIYDPVADSWSALTGPGWSNIGDAPNVVLPGGQFLLGHITDSQLASLDPTTLTWTQRNGTNKADHWNGEEGWALLPDGTVLTVDTNDGTQAERYFPATDTWQLAGSTIANLVTGYETGPEMLRPDGTVFAAGALGHTSIYSVASGKWTAGPDFPSLGGKPLAVFDGPASLLPDGNVLIGANPLTVTSTGGQWLAPTQYFEFDGTSLNAAPSPPHASTDVTYFTRMLPLPDGQVMFSDDYSDIELYTPAGQANPSWAPAISASPDVVVTGQTYTVTGTQFNGLSAAASYGDDNQQATNYPLVRITNNTTGHVFYYRTHNHSTMAVATGSALVSTEFDVPASAETGPSTMVVVANGISSNSWNLFVSAAVPETITFGSLSNVILGAAPFTVSATASSGLAVSFASTTLTVCTVSGSTVTIVAAGTCSITASQAGNAIYAAAASVTQSFTVIDNTVYLTTSVSPANSGTISLNPASPANSFASGSIVCLTAAPAAGQIFTGWTGTTLNAAGCLTLTANASITANFQANPVTAPSALRFVPATPCRLVDTRNANGPLGGPSVGGGGARSFTIPGTCNIPSTALAYSLNLTVVPYGTLGYVTLWPTGQTQPVVSTLNSLDGRVKSNAAIVTAGTGGAVSVFATDSTDVILDINGYFDSYTDPAALQFYPLTPCRVADTRNSTGLLAGPSLQASQARSFPVMSSTCGIPGNALAYSLNFTAIPQGPLGYLTVWPNGQSQPVVSTLNAPTGAVTANAAIVSAGTGGAIELLATNNSDMAIDINGYFAAPAGGGLSLYNLRSCRIKDTRLPAGTPAFTGTVTETATGVACGVPPEARSLVLNATVVPSGELGYLSLWANGGSQPVVSTLNSLDGSVTSNMAIVPGSNGLINAYAAGPAATYLILDISGYFAP